MKIGYFGTVLCLVGICVIAAITSISQSKQEKSLDDRIMEIVNWSMRLAAVRGLANYNDPEAIALIEEVAKNDPREVPNEDGRSKVFPVREAAQKALRSMKSALPNK